MSFDDVLPTEALFLADGADIHNVAGLVAMYRCLKREGLDATEIERKLRHYVARKRMERLSVLATRASVSSSALIPH
jgi:hypothetical protein